MAFEAKRLRVQLPCGDETRVVEEAADDRQGVCVAVGSACAANNSCFLYATHCLPHQTCHYPTEPPCHNPVSVPRCPGHHSRCPGFPSMCAGVASGCPGFATNCGIASGGHCPDFHSGCPVGGWSCEWDSCETGTHCYQNTNLPVYVAAEGRGSLVSPDDLPVLRGRLEQRLKEVDAFAQRLKDRVQAQLEDVERAESALRERFGDEEGKE